MIAQPNWDLVRDEVTGLLQDLIRIDTTNPPGNEIVAADYIATRLREVGIEPQVFESEPKRGNVVGRWQGTGAAQPILLMGHIDVVPVERQHWTHDPFGGEIDGGYLWGRGALDMKCTVAAELMLIRLLARAGVPLKRDIIFMANADEEMGGRKGAGWMVQHHPDLIRAEYALNEGGGQVFPLGDKMLYSVQTAEKGLARFKMTVRGEPGHGSVPRDDNPVALLGAAVWKLGSTPMPLHVTRTVEAMLKSMAVALPQIEPLLPAILTDNTSQAAINQMPLTESYRRSLNAMLRNTAVPTILNAGTKINVIPSVAEARVDGRSLPGFNAESFMAEVRPIVGDGVDIEILDDMPPLEADLDSPFYHAIVDVMKTRLPGAYPSPVLVTGATDARHVCKLGTRVYGFAPTRHEPAVADLSLVHGHDERISIDNLLFMTQTMYDIVAGFASQ